MSNDAVEALVILAILPVAIGQCVVWGAKKAWRSVCSGGE